MNQNPCTYLYSGLLFVAALAVISFIYAGIIGAKEIGTTCLAMVGTFVGALLAFRLNESRENAKLEKERKAALNNALFIIFRQHNAIGCLARELGTYQSEFERAFVCPAIRPPLYLDLVHDFEALGFLLEAADPNLLMRISIEQEGFHQTIESLNERNKFYVDEVQPLIAKHQLNGRTVTVDEFQSKLGELVYNGAITRANVLYENLAGSGSKLPAIHSELSGIAKKLYPKGRFTKIDPEAQPVNNPDRK